MFAKLLAAVFVLVLSSQVLAQDGDRADLKKRILERVREKLAAERAAFLKKVEKIIEEEYAKPPVAKTPAPAPGPKAAPPAAGPTDAKVKELEKKLRQLEEQREAAAAELSKAKRLAEDDAVRKEAEKDGPHGPQEAQAMFKEALKLHEGKSFDKSIRMFKKVHYQFPQTEIAYICAYNVACGYALAGQKEAALDWLELSIEGGYDDFDHMRKDTDLDSLRGERRYKKLLADR